MILYLKKWFWELRKSVPALEPTVSGIVNESVSRFLTSKRQFAKSKNKVKYSAFMPNRNGETSVYRTTGISSTEIWLIGEKFVRFPIAKSHGSCTLYGRGEVEVKEILDANLALVPNPTPHPRHADISDWPASKENRMMLATMLANKAILHLPPN